MVSFVCLPPIDVLAVKMYRLTPESLELCGVFTAEQSMGSKGIPLENIGLTCCRVRIPIVFPIEKAQNFPPFNIYPNSNLHYILYMFMLYFIV